MVVAAIAAIAAIPLLRVHSCFSTSRSAMCISTAPAMGGHEQVFCPDCRTDAKTNFFCSFLPTLDAGRSLARPFIEKELERERDVYICIYSHTKRIIHRRCVRSLLIIYISMFPRKKTPKTYMYTECIIHAFCFAVFLVCWVCFAVLSFAQHRLTIFLFAGFVLPFCLSHSIV